MSALVEALVAAQADLPCAIGKDSDGQIQSRTYRYLSLDKLIEVTRPILTAHGLTIVQHPTCIEREGGLSPGLKTVLMHTSGETVTDVCPLYLPEKRGMQDLGSALTYARRYSWQAVLGIAAEEDTDGPTLADADVPF